MSLVGPGIWEPESVGSRESPRDERPLVLVTCSTEFQNDGRLVEVARHVEQAGAGTRLLPRRLGPERLRRAVREAMARAPGARRVAEGVRSAGGAHAAADALESAARTA